MQRTAYLIDGFSLYHGLRAAREPSGNRPMLWLDIRALCTTYLAQARRATGGEDACLAGIHYFSARPIHRSKDKLARHGLYMECLRSTDVNVRLGRFRFKDVTCPLCQQMYRRHEEKQTDVALGVRLLETFYEDEADIIALVTGDTDLIPAVQACQRPFPRKLVCFIFPFRRSNNSLIKLAPHSVKMARQTIERHQFADPLTLPNGRKVHRPPHW